MLITCSNRDRDFIFSSTCNVLSYVNGQKQNNLVFIQAFVYKAEHKKLCMCFIGDIYGYGYIWIWIDIHISIQWDQTIYTVLYTFCFLKKTTSWRLFQTAQKDLPHSFWHLEILKVGLWGTMGLQSDIAKQPSKSLHQFGPICSSGEGLFPHTKAVWVLSSFSSFLIW